MGDVKKDIDLVFRQVETLRQLADRSGRIPQDKIKGLAEKLEPGEWQAFTAAFNWFCAGGLKSVFLQDADTLIIKPHDLVDILVHLKQRFPEVERITSYARSHTIVQKKDADLKAIREAGLNRLHIGLESGSDEVLARVRKGSTREIHIQAGRKVKNAGFELSEYYMPGLGGRELSEVHALESAAALNLIDPDFIRIRTLAIPGGAPLHQEYNDGRFTKCTDIMTAGELLTFIENLDGITSIVRSDHILNLFEDLEGTLPRDRERMVGLLRTFLEMGPRRQSMYQVGRRLGILSRISDMEDPGRMALVEQSCRAMRITPDNVDEITDEMMKRYI